MKIAKLTMFAFFISSMAHAVDSQELAAKNLDYCKVSYTDNYDGTAGTYRGQCMGKVPHGSGQVNFYNGDKLTGTFERGELVGEVTITSSDGNVYQGTYQDGKRHGSGTFTWARGSRYEGEWIDDKRHGKGVFTWANGNRFEGEFRDNKQYNGKYFTSNGHIYKCRLGQCK